VLEQLVGCLSEAVTTLIEQLDRLSKKVTSN
jgi:hypothetical protein